MTTTTSRAGLSVDERLAQFLESEVLAPLGRDAALIYRCFVRSTYHICSIPGIVDERRILCHAAQGGTGLHNGFGRIDQALNAAMGLFDARGGGRDA